MITEAGSEMMQPQVKESLQQPCSLQKSDRSQEMMVDDVRWQPQLQLPFQYNVFTVIGQHSLLIC